MEAEFVAQPRSNRSIAAAAPASMSGITWLDLLVMVDDGHQDEHGDGHHRQQHADLSQRDP